MLRGLQKWEKPKLQFVALSKEIWVHGLFSVLLCWGWDRRSEYSLPNVLKVSLYSNSNIKHLSSRKQLSSYDSAVLLKNFKVPFPSKDCSLRYFKERAIHIHTHYSRIVLECVGRTYRNTSSCKSLCSLRTVSLCFNRVLQISWTVYIHLAPLIAQSWKELDW